MSKLEARIASAKIMKIIPAAAMAVYLAACGSGGMPGGPTTPTSQPVMATAAGSVRGGYNGTAKFGTVSGEVKDGNYSVPNIQIEDSPSGTNVDGSFTGDSRYLGRIARFNLKKDTNTFPLIDVLENTINGITIDPTYLGATANNQPNGVINWPEGIVPEVLIVEDSFNKSELLRNLYIFNFRQNGIDNATQYLPRLLLDNPSPGNYRIVNGNYSCSDPANRNKILFKGGTAQDIGDTRFPAANFKSVDDANNNIYCVEVIMTDKAGPAEVHHEFANAAGLLDTNAPSPPSIVNSGNRTGTITAFDVAYSHAKRKMQNKSKITDGMYDTRHLGVVRGQ